MYVRTVATRLTSTSKFSYISHYIKFSSKLTIRNIVAFKESLAVEPFHREATPLLLDLYAAAALVTPFPLIYRPLPGNGVHLVVFLIPTTKGRP